MKLVLTGTLGQICIYIYIIYIYIWHFSLIILVFYKRSIPGVVLIEPWKFSLDLKRYFELPISSVNKWMNCILYI